MSFEQFAGIGLIALLFLALIGVAVFFFGRTLGQSRERRSENFTSVLSMEYNYNKIRKSEKIPCSIMYGKITLSGDSGSISLKSDLSSFVRDTTLKTFLNDDNMISFHDGKGYIILSRLCESSMVECAKQVSHALTLQNDSAKKKAQINMFWGSYLLPANDVSFEEAVERAILAAEEAERRNTVYVAWDYNLQKSIDEAKGLNEQFKKGLGENNFFLEFQPIVNLETGNIVAGEVLTRLSDNSTRIIAPNNFLPVINDNGMNRNFDFYIFEKFCKWASLRTEMFDTLKYISVNFSRSTIALPDYYDNFVEMVDRYHLPYPSIAVEVLEDSNEISYDMQAMCESLKKLRNLGVNILLDDFGECNMSLTDLHILPINILKIDRMTMRKVNTEIGSKNFRSVLGYARDLGVSVICEGVENPEQIDYLKKNKCKYVQGYYFYHPMHADQFEKLVRNTAAV